MSLFYYPYPGIAAPTEEYILVEINARLVPVIISALERYKYPQFWLTDADYQAGVQQLCELQESLLTGATNVTEAIDRVYRLLDSALNGAAYVAEPDPQDPTRSIVYPALPAAPANLVGIAPGLRRQLLDLQGVINAGWFGIGGEPATLADIVNALRIGSANDTQRITDAIDQIAGDSLLAQTSQAANIFSTVKGLITDVAGATAEGALLGTLIAGQLATSGMLGVLSSQLDRLTASLDGGGPIGPSDNVLTALRGTVTASTNRNVIDAAGGTNLVELLDQVETILGEIRTLLS